MCNIGRVVAIDRGRVSLLEINPGATWDAEPVEYPMREITRVGFGADYENALHLVGGSPPALSDARLSTRKESAGRRKARTR